jgi:two-component system alkaline phosphatase synthesis response regulator PhoP
MSDATGKHILLVDDSPVVADTVRDTLEPFGFRVAWIEDGAGIPKALERQMPDLAILDVMMPGVDGYEACRRLRADPKTAHLPILMLTARAEEADKVVGLELGADDYLAKPFGERELLARVRALLRRVARAEAPTEMLRAGPITLDLARHQAQCAGTPLDLTLTEFELLHMLMANPGQTLGRETLLDKVWGYDWYGNARVVDTHVQHLRRKLHACYPDEDLILTVRGMGYRFAA